MLLACFLRRWLPVLLLTSPASILCANTMPAIFYRSGLNSFVVRTAGMRAIFSPEGVEYRHAGARMRVDFENPNSSVVIEGDGQLPGVVNFLLGDDPHQWRVGVPVYAGIVYRDLYPGIDVRYFTKDGALKAEYLVSPGANYRRIRLRYSGAQPAIDRTGNLVARSGQGELRESNPLTFGRNRRLLISRYSHIGGGAIGIEIEGAPAGDPIVIDPVITFSSYIGGAAFDGLTSVAVDGSGNIYAAGWTESSGFPVSNALQPGFGGSVDAVVLKVNSANALVYATFLGGNGDDRAFGIAVDPAGNVAVTGWTYSTNFPKVSAAQSAPGGGRDAFVAKLNPSGSAFLFSTWLGGSGADRGNAVSLDTSGNIYVAGETDSVSFPFVNPYQSSNRGGSDAFIAKYSASGALVFSTCFGGTGDDRATAITVDSSGSIYFAGSTYSTDFPVVNAFQSTLGGGQDAFVAKLNPSGTALAYSTYFGGWNKAGEFEEAAGIAVDGSGNAIIAGTTSSRSFPVLNAIQPTIAGGNTDGFIAKLSSAGNSLLFSTYLGGAAEEQLNGVALAADGGIIVAGYTGSSNFPIANPLQSTKAPGYDAIIARLSANGSNLEFSTFLGGNDQDDALAVKADSNSTIVVVGQTQSSNFPLAAQIQSTNGGLYGGFVTRIQFSGDMTPPGVTITSPVSTPSYSTSNVTLNLAGSASDNVAVTQVTWSCDRCGSGTASGTANWAVSGITLQYGVNKLVVTAQDAAGNQGTAALTVTYTLPDTTPPTIVITSPVSTPSYSTSNGTLNLAGSASDNFGVTQITWSCDRCGSGTASGTASWIVTGITLQSGVNKLVVTAQDAAGNQGTAALTVTYTPPDTTPPTIVITSPVSTPSYNTTASTLNLAGSASDNKGVTQITWSCDRCGSGVATGTTSWSVSGVTLLPGSNAIAVTAWDAAGNQATATLTTNYTIYTSPSPVLRVALTHTGNFSLGQSYALYIVSVSNSISAGPTNGLVTVTENLPPGLILVSMSGSGWFCPGGPTCTRSDVLAAGADYPGIVVYVNVSPNAGSPQLNSVTVSGGGSAAATTTDSTVIASATRPAFDFDGDGKSDILWQQPVSGDLWVWFMNGSYSAGSTVITGATDWRTPGAADFNGDGKPDILWQHPVSGELWVWFMNGAVSLGSARIGGSAVWKVVGTGDFNGDGKSDILWQNSTSGELWVWFMNGIAQIGAAQLNGATDWKSVGTADINGDGRPDILWQHPSSGELWVWYMSGIAQIGAAPLAGATAWRVAGTGDYKGDGKTGILWQLPATGELWTWFMNGTAQTSAAQLSGPTAWKAIGSH
jgi:hypothetical protein